MVSSGRCVVRLLFLVVLCGGSPPQVLACPFCRAPSLTLSEQIEQAVSVKLIKLEARPSSTRDRLLKPAVGRFRVIDEFAPPTTTAGGEPALKDRRPSRKKHTTPLRVGTSAIQVLRLELAPGWKPGGEFVLIQRKHPGREGDVPLPVSRAAWSYLKSMPPRADSTPDRLRYFVRYLEYPNVMIANDAYGEFANARYEDIVAMRDALPRRRLRRWIFGSRNDRSVIATRLGLYGMLLGLCGEPSDAASLKRVIVDEWKPDAEFRLGIDGMIGGYLLLTGEDGLEVIERTKLTNRDVDFSETYAAMQALRFVWTYGDGVINQDRLRRAMRLLLDHPDLTDLAIADLARWKDWEIQPRLMQMYDEDECQVPAIKRAIVRFMLVSSRPAKRESADKGRPEPAHVTQSRRYLAILRARDPKIVSDCERFYFLK